MGLKSIRLFSGLLRLPLPNTGVSMPARIAGCGPASWEHLQRNQGGGKAFSHSVRLPALQLFVS